MIVAIMSLSPCGSVYCVSIPSTLWQYQQLFRNTLTKLFADLEIKKKHLEDREQSER